VSYPPPTIASLQVPQISGAPKPDSATIETEHGMKPVLLTMAKSANLLVYLQPHRQCLTAATRIFYDDAMKIEDEYTAHSFVSGNGLALLE
jgi:hypothetical protein